MEIKKYLREALKTNHGGVKRALDDIDDEESLERGGRDINHIRWIAGHLASSAGLMLQIMGGEQEIDESWKKLFARGADFSEESSVYPTMKQIREKLYGLYDKMYAALEKMSVEELEVEKEIIQGWKSTPAEALEFLCRHEFYHLGQVATLRKILGRERMFG